jgi:thiamine kinase
MPDRAAAAQGDGRERVVRDALRTAESTAALADAPMTVQQGGLSNHAWVAQSQGHRYFVRLSPADSARLGVDRASECALLQVVARAGLAPEVRRCDPSQRLLVTRYVDGHPLARHEAITPSSLVRVGAALRTLHAQPVPAGIRHVDFAAQAVHLEAQCVGDSAVGAELRDRARETFAELARAGRRDTLCHNDLHHLNLVEGTERLWFVDWEYGGAGDPVFDFASFLSQHDCGPHERDHLLDAYGVDAAPGFDALRAACWAFDYVQWLWYRAWPAGDGADLIYAERAAALERRLCSTHPAGFGPRSAILV